MLELQRDRGQHRQEHREEQSGPVDLSDVAKGTDCALGAVVTAEAELETMVNRLQAGAHRNHQYQDDQLPGATQVLATMPIDEIERWEDDGVLQAGEIVIDVRQVVPLGRHEADDQDREQEEHRGPKESLDGEV